MMLKVEPLIKFIQSQNEDDSFEYLAMSHLKMSALYWSLAALFLLKGENALSFSPMPREEIINFLQACRNKDGGYGGDAGYDSHLLFTLSALQVYKMLEMEPQEKRLTVSYVLGLMREDGSFQGDAFGEVDTRFSYCGLVSLHLLGFDFEAQPQVLEKGPSFIEKCRNWDGGFGHYRAPNHTLGKYFAAKL